MAHKIRPAALLGLLRPTVKIMRAALKNNDLRRRPSAVGHYRTTGSSSQKSKHKHTRATLVTSLLDIDKFKKPYREGMSET